jgi:purine-binding chemotaxis protein CheW
MDSKTMEAANNPQDKNNNGVSVIGGKYLTFFLSQEEYGIEILKVHEIIGRHPITRVPNTQNYLKGVINLRGKVIPIVDARLKFGMPSVEGTNKTCIIVTNIHGLEVGIIVDRVSEVVDIPEKDAEAAPSFGMGCNTDYILGIGKVLGRVMILLNIDRVLLSNELSHFDSITAGTEKLTA